MANSKDSINSNLTREQLIQAIADKEKNLADERKILQGITKPSQIKSQDAKVQAVNEELQKLKNALKEFANRKNLLKAQSDIPSAQGASGAGNNNAAASDAQEKLEGVGGVKPTQKKSQDQSQDSQPPAQDAEFTSAAGTRTLQNQKDREEEAAKKDLELKNAAARAAALASAGQAPAKPQAVLDAGTKTSPKEKAEGPEGPKIDEFPKFPASGDWVAQMLWLLDILFFNSSVGRPPIANDVAKAKGFIQRVGEGFANLAADFKEAFPNANRLIRGTVGAAVTMAYNVAKGATKIAIGGARLAQGVVVTTVGTAVASIAAPIAALAAPKGKGAAAAANLFAPVMRYGIQPLARGGAGIVDGVGNALAAVPRGLAAVRDFGMGVVGIGKDLGRRMVGLPQESFQDRLTILDKAESILSGNDPEFPPLASRVERWVKGETQATSAASNASTNTKASLSSANAAVTPSNVRGAPAAMPNVGGAPAAMPNAPVVAPVSAPIEAAPKGAPIPKGAAINPVPPTQVQAQSQAVSPTTQSPTPAPPVAATPITQPAVASTASVSTTSSVGPVLGIVQTQQPVQAQQPTVKTMDLMQRRQSLAASNSSDGSDDRTEVPASSEAQKAFTAAPVATNVDPTAAFDPMAPYGDDDQDQSVVLIAASKELGAFKIDANPDDPPALQSMDGHTMTGQYNKKIQAEPSIRDKIELEHPTPEAAASKKEVQDEQNDASTHNTPHPKGPPK